MRFLLFAAALAAAAPVGAATVVVTGGRLVDVVAGRVVQNPVIVITDGRITSVSQGGAIPAGARRIGLAGMTLLPGLIDMHVHLDSNPRYGGYTGLQFTDSFWVAQGTAAAR